MQKKSLTILMIFLMLSVGLQAAATDSLIGEWRGSAKVSALPFSFSTTVKVNEDRTFSISFIGFNANGVYTVSDSAITVTQINYSGLLAKLVPPENLDTVILPYTLRDGILTIVGNALGINGMISLSRR